MHGEADGEDVAGFNVRALMDTSMVGTLVDTGMVGALVDTGMVGALVDTGTTPRRSPGTFTINASRRSPPTLLVQINSDR